MPSTLYSYIKSTLFLINLLFILVRYYYGDYVVICAAGALLVESSVSDTQLVYDVYSRRYNPHLVQFTFICYVIKNVLKIYIWKLFVYN